MDILIRRINIPFGKIKEFSEGVENTWEHIRIKVDSKVRNREKIKDQQNMQKQDSIMKHQAVEQKKEPKKKVRQNKAAHDDKRDAQQPTHTSRLLDMKKRRKM